MQISRKAEYALHALIYIASTSGERACSINEIAHNAKIPREYLAKVLKGLTNDNFLVSSRGINGGYRLKKAAKDISYLNVLEAAEGTFKVTLCNDNKNCPDFAFWDNVRKSLVQTLSDMNLSKVEFKKNGGKGKKAGKA
jgi:Rrf2 family protein